MAQAFEDKSIRPASRVVELAAAGELTLNGQPVAAFKCNADTVRHEARVLRKRRAGRVTSKLAETAPADAVETLRRRLVNAADAMLQEEEKRSPKVRDPGKLREIARAVREIAAIPGPRDPRPVPPGAKKDGKREGGETRTGLAGDILRDHAQSRSGQTASTDVATPPPANPAPHALPTHPSLGETNTSRGQRNGTAPNDATHENAEEDSSPGSLVRERAAALGLDL